MGRRDRVVLWVLVALVAGLSTPAVASAEKPLDGFWDVPDTRWGDWTPGYGYIGTFYVKGGGTRIENFALAVEECRSPNPDHGICLPPCQVLIGGLSGPWPTVPVAADGSFSYTEPGRITVAGKFVAPDRVEGTVRVDPAYCAQAGGATRTWAGQLHSPDDPGAMVRPKPAGPGCETEVTVGTRTAWSTCFRRAGDAWTSDVPMRLAGIDFEPRAGAIRLEDRGMVTGDARLYFKGGGPALAGQTIELSEGKFRLDTTSARALSLGAPKVPPIAGMPILGGKIKLSWLSGDSVGLTMSASLGRQVSLFAPGGSVDVDESVGAELSLKASNARGLIVDEITAQLKRGRLFGPTGMLFQGLSLGYRPAEDLWRGTVSVKPVPKKDMTLTAGLSFRTKPFEFGGASIEGTELQVNLYRILFLQKLAGELKTLPPPWSLSGSAGFSIGKEALPGHIPVVGGEYPVYAEGGYTWTGAGVFTHTGTSKILGQTATDTEEKIDGPNATASVAGNMSFTLFDTGLRGFLAGWLNPRGFQFAGDAETTVLGHTMEGGRGLISNRGYAVCGSKFGVDLGYSVRWSQGLDFDIGCGWDELIQAAPAAVAEQDGSRAFRVRGAARPLALRIGGAGGVPAVELRGPGGQAVQIPAGAQPFETPDLLALKDARGGRLDVFLRRARPGRWSVAPMPGSPAVTGLAQARRLPRARVRARVGSGRGERKVLRFRARRVRGQRLVFVERGPGGLARQLGATRRARGRIAFRPAPGPRARRRVEVAVEQNGAPRASFTVARYAYRPGRLHPPRGLRVRRRATTATVRWRRVAGASEYLVGGRLRGRPALRTLVDGRTLRLRGLRRRTTGRLTVRAIAADGRMGAAARVKLRRR